LQLSEPTATTLPRTDSAEDSTPAREPLRRRAVATVRRVPLLVWTITALHLTILLGYSVLLPTYRAPDEPQHADLAHVMSEEWDYPAWDERDLAPGLQQSLDEVFFHIPRSSAHLTSDEAPPKGERPSIEDLDTPPRPTGINQNSQHPPLYYLVAGNTERAVETVTGGDLPFDLEVWIYRLVSIALVAPLPLVIWRIAQLLNLPRAVGIAAALVPLTIPQFTHIGSAVNNDSLLMLGFWLSTPVILRIAKGALNPRTAMLAGALTGMTALTKGFAVVLPLWIGGALLIALRRGGRDSLRPAVNTGAIYAVTAFVTGGWWWLRNLVLYGNLAPSRFSELLPPAEEIKVDLDEFVRTWAYRTTRRFWGDFGWFDTAIPAPVFGVATVVVIAAIALALLRSDRVGSTLSGDRFILAAPLLMLVALQMGNAFRAYSTTGRLPGLQGRYWFGALAGVAVVVALGLANLMRGSLQRLPLLMLVAVVVMQGFGVTTLLGHYWGAPHSALSERVRAVVAWSPLPGEMIGAGLVIAGLVVLAAAAQAIALAIRATDEQLVAADDKMAGLRPR